MTWLDRASHQIAASYAIIFNRTDDAPRLDVSITAIRQSFDAVPLAALFALGLYYSAYNSVPLSDELARAMPLAHAGLPLFMAAQFLGFVLVWAISLTLIVNLAARLSPVGAGTAIVLYNWTQPPLFAVEFVPFGVMAAGGHVAYLQLLSLPAIAFMLFQAWRFTRTIFPVSLLGVMAILLMLMLVDIAVSSLITALFMGIAGESARIVADMTVTGS